ncbi:hypothetical protein OROMI_012606 [Orobanche minor]
MRDLESQLPPGVRDGGPKDIFSQVLGEDIFAIAIFT